MADIDFIFRVPLIKVKVRDWNRKRGQLLDIMDRGIAAETMRRDIDEHNLMDTDFFSSDARVDNARLASEILHDELTDFSAAMQAKESKVSIAWFERTHQHQSHPVHTHGPMGYSAVCYIEYDSDVHQPTMFMAPFMNFITGSDLIHRPDGIESGTILFFPSALLHYTVPNLAEKPRTVLSFNLDLIYP